MRVLLARCLAICFKWKLAQVEPKLWCWLISFMWLPSLPPHSLPLEVLGTFCMEIKTLILRHRFNRNKSPRLLLWTMYRLLCECVCVLCELCGAMACCQNCLLCLRVPPAPIRLTCTVSAVVKQLPGAWWIKQNLNKVVIDFHKIKLSMTEC